MSKRPLLIFDLDNTLYDWVTYFATSFRAMLLALAQVLDVGEDQLVSEFKQLHQEYGTSEQPFLMLELPTVRARFPGLSRAQLLHELESARRAFSGARRKTLRLYPGVAETLGELYDLGYLFVAHTEASAVNAFYRLRRLDIDRYFTRLYVQSIPWKGHPLPEREAALRPPPALIREVSRSERKPNPALLVDICLEEGFEIGDAWFIGDSLVRDISMAKMAGVQSAWARYGTRYDPGLWSLLVRITHWSDEDVAREAELRNSFQDVQPDFVLDSFDQLPKILRAGVTCTGNDA
jgi:phosphoglycolate phosphatase